MSANTHTEDRQRPPSSLMLVRKWEQKAAANKQLRTSKFRRTRNSLRRSAHNSSETFFERKATSFCIYTILYILLCCTDRSRNQMAHTTTCNLNRPQPTTAHQRCNSSASKSVSLVFTAESPFFLPLKTALFKAEKGKDSLLRRKSNNAIYSR